MTEPPWHRRLTVRIGAGFAAVALGSAALVGVPLFALATRQVRESEEERLEATAELAVLGVPAGALATPEGRRAAAAWLETVRDEGDLHEVVLLDGAGGVVVGAPFRADPEVLARALVEDAAVTEVYRGPDGERYQSAFAPVDADEDGRADYLLGVEAPAATARLDALRAWFIGAGVVWIGTVAALGAWTARRVANPVRALLAAAARIEAGEAPAPAPARGDAELVALQEAFWRMAAAVRLREAWLRAMAATVAHEVRNPAHAMGLHLGLMARDLRSDAFARAESRIPTLLEELAHLEATVVSMLAFASGRSIARKRVPVGDLFTRVLDGAEVQAPDALVDLDGVLVARAVENLVRNARQAGAQHVRVAARLAEGALVVEVTDDGPGFPPHLADRAFEPFVSGRTDGSGIGLAIVAAVARAHGGHARVARPGPDGTVVELRLPLA